MTQRNMTPEQREELRKVYKPGMLRQPLLEKFNISYNVLEYEIRVIRNEQKPGQPWTAEQAEFAQAMKNQSLMAQCWRPLKFQKS